MAVTTALTWLIVGTAMRGIMIIPIIIFWAISCCVVRRRGDPARTAFSYLHAIYPFLMLWVVVVVVADIMAIIFTSYILYEAQYRLDFVGDLSQEIADILTVICLVELGNGFLSSLEQVQAAFQRYARLLILAVGVLVFILSIAWFGLWNAQYTNYFNYLYNDATESFDFDSFRAGIHTGYQLDTAGDVILLIATLATVAYAGYVLHRCRSAPTLKNSAVLFLVATIINLIRRCWNIAVDAWALQVVKQSSAVGQIVDPIINVWAEFVLLVLIFVIGQRKHGGLWTTLQPWSQQGMGIPPMGPIQQPEAMMWQGQPVWQHQQSQAMMWQGQPVWQHQQPQQQIGYVASRPAEMQGWQQAPVYTPSPAGELESAANRHEMK